MNNRLTESAIEDFVIKLMSGEVRVALGRIRKAGSIIAPMLQGE